MDKNELGASTYSHVRGHVTCEIGRKVEKFKVEDQMVGVRRMVRSCHTCDSCSNNLENYCPKLYSYISGYVL
uniref:Uncharacterized protein n=1 Tax=Populus trichocarpa TaxID=3694 RepID=U7DVF9_POPTR